MTGRGDEGGAVSAETGVQPYRGPRIVVLPDADAFAAAAAQRVAEVLAETVRRSGVARLALSGGSTPGPVYRRLAGEPYRQRVPWSALEIFWSDERCVPPDDPRSNYRAASEALLSRVPVAAQQVHRMRGELPPDEAVAAYELEMTAALGPLAAFDLLLLGMGVDGHTASLFPRQFAGGVADPHPGALVAATEAPVEPRRRITCTLSCLNAARRILFLVRGAGKADMVARVVAAQRAGRVGNGMGNGVPPAARVRPVDGELTWILDEAAAAKLPEEAR